MRDLLTTAADVIETDFAALQLTIAASPAVRRASEPDATVYWSDTDLPALNTITNAHIAPQDAAERSAELIAPFITRGRPFRWVTTPRTTTPALEAALAQAGLRAREYPAMYVALGPTIDPGTPDDVFIDVAWPDGVAPVAESILEGLGHPASSRADRLGVLDTLDPEDNQFFVARDMRTGKPLGAGTLHTRNDSFMVANVSTVVSARGRGIGRALVATMMNRGATTGVQTATVVSNPRAYTTYVDLGFRTQFNVVSWVWDPRV
ncbi:GNAT family N-acetyltransferase [Nocardioides gilvus]|uniref:GNAT family N-acetyltransferase n=1 Tax=Nocardioides gilvus TaxID=1735589 RepID=UPI000D742BA6|nr:GNAT family N-acetyltransferase [Nocardioides gilvus]